MIILDYIYDILWIFVSIILLFLGLYLTFKLGIVQLHIRKIFKSLFKNKNSFNGLMISLGGRVGVGSIAGISLAIYMGGVGALFWLFLINIIAMPLVYAEVYLSVKYREKTYVGPANYICNKNMKIIYSLIIIICYIFGFVSIQANTITMVIVSSFNISNYVVGTLLCFITIIIIFSGISMISKVLNKIVPLMGIIYIFMALFIFIKNICLMPIILKLIFYDALNYRSLISGIFSQMLIGIRRGIFASEIGIGTSSMACGVNSNIHAMDHGYIQLLGIYITIFLVCFSTAIIILTSNYSSLNIIDPNGIEIALNAFIYHFGKFGNILLIILVILFAFSTILSNYYYGEVSIRYVFGNSKLCIMLLKFLTLMIIFLGSINSSILLWKSSDILISILVIINVYAIYKMRSKIKT